MTGSSKERYRAVRSGTEQYGAVQGGTEWYRAVRSGTEQKKIMVLTRQDQFFKHNV